MRMKVSQNEKVKVSKIKEYTNLDLLKTVKEFLNTTNYNFQFGSKNCGTNFNQLLKNRYVLNNHGFYSLLTHFSKLW